jgi:hypothetical protein
MPVPLSATKDAVDDAVEIDRQLPVPIVIGRLLQWPEDRHAGGIEQQFDRAEPGLHRIRRGRISGSVGDIELDRHHLEIGLVEPGHRLVEMVLADIGDGDLASGLREYLGLAERYSRSAAGDEGGAPRHPGHRADSFSLTPFCLP